MNGLQANQSPSELIRTQQPLLVPRWAGYSVKRASEVCWHVSMSPHRFVRWIALVLCVSAASWGADLTALPEHLRPDPFGGIVEVDRVAGAAPTKAIAVETPRGAYVSFHLLA